MFKDYKKYLLIGPQCSGKSVLLASLLDGLIKKPGSLWADAASWTSHRVEPYGRGYAHFPLQRILDEAAHQGSWPESTRQPMAIRFRALAGNRMKKWKHEVIRDFFDFPGESFADFLGTELDGSRSAFDNWSNGVLEKFPLKADPPSVADIGHYENMLRRHPPVSAEELVNCYHQALRDAGGRYRYLLSPATIVGCNDRFGTETVLPDRFAPLPERYRNRHVETRSEFARQFRDYQKQVVNPLRRLLWQADVVIIPVDVAWILTSGMAAFRDQINLLDALAGYLRRLEGWLKNISSAMWRQIDKKGAPGRLRRILICGTKLDVFAPEDGSRLEDLVKAFTGNLRRSARFAGVRVEYAICSAMRSSYPDPARPGLLCGYINGRETSVQPSRLPEEWPEEWTADEYRFATELDPRLHKSGLYPPRHQNLDQVLRKLEGW